MKTVFSVLFALTLSFSMSFASTSNFGETAPSDQSEEAVRKAIEEYKLSLKNMTKQERKLKKKEARKQIKKAIKEGKDADTERVLLIIAAIFLPPVAMFFYEGDFTTRFWLSLGLWLIFLLPGIIYTLVVIVSES